jgi:anti-sigma B factor antagonist
MEPSGPPSPHDTAGPSRLSGAASGVSRHARPGLIGIAGVGGPHLEVSWDASGSLVVRGEVDPASADRFAEGLKTAAADAPGDLVVDLRELTFMDSAGLRVLIDLARDLGPGRAVVLRAPQPGVLRLFEVAGIEGLGPFRVER